MHICYIDESGCLGSLPSSSSPIQPIFLMSGVFIHHSSLQRLTHGLISLKSQYYPGLVATSNYLDRQIIEIKGSSIRKQLRSSNRNERRHAATFLDRVVRLCTDHDISVVSRIWIKKPESIFIGRSVYTYSAQAICLHFQNYLERNKSIGIVIADSRKKTQNANVSHSIFTKKFKVSGDEYPHIVEMPTFGHSENHAGLQLVDYISSTLLYPMASSCYCQGYINSIHVDPGYSMLKPKFGQALQDLQFRYRSNSRWVGGITVTDAIAGRSSALLF